MALTLRITAVVEAIRDKFNTMTPRLLPLGGSDGQVLAINSDTFTWVDRDAAPGTITLSMLGGDITTAAKSLLDDPSIPAIRTTLGLGDAALRPASYFALAVHTHAISDITGLQTALDAKLNLSVTSTYGRTVIGATDAASARTILQLGSASQNATSDFALAVHTHAISDITGLQTALSNKESSISSGTTAQYWRGDKTFQTLDRSAVGLSAVDNTNDAAKPISIAQQTAFDLKLDSTHAGTGGSAHAIATSTEAGFITASDKFKLDSVANSATANSTDQQLRDRSTHTGVQAISTITGLDTALAENAPKGLLTSAELTMTSGKLIGRATSGTGSVEEISLGAGFSFSSGAIIFLAPDGTLSNAKFTSVASGIIKGRRGASTGPVEDLSGDDATSLLSLFSSTLKGLVPASGGGSTAYLRADGSWSIPPNTGVWGSITGTLLAQTDLTTALNARQPLAANLTSITSLVGAVDTIPYFTGVGTLATSSFTGYARTLNSAVDSSVARSTLGLSNVNNTSDASKPLSTATVAALALKIDVSEKGIANGVATLDSGGKLPTSQLPPLAINDVFLVSSQSAQLALTAQAGDIAIRSDINDSFIHNGGTSNTMADWQEIRTPAVVASVNGHIGTVVLDKTDVGLANVDNTSDVNKPISTAQAAGFTAQTAALTAHSGSPTAHPVATETVPGFMSATDKTKLDGVDNRANHTGTQTYTTVTMPSGAVLGRGSSGTGAVEALTIGDGLSVASGILSVSQSVGGTFNPITATGTGSPQDITLPTTSLTPFDVLVTIEGLVQDPVDFTISGTTLTLTATLGSSIVVRKPAGARGLPANKVAVTVGDGTATSFNIDHNMGTRDVSVTLYDTTTYADINPPTVTITRPTTNRVTLVFTAAPSSAGVRAVII